METITNMAAERDYLTPNEVANLLQVSPITVRQWAQKGLLPAQTTAGGHRRFQRSQVELFARDRGMSGSTPARTESLLIVDDNRSFNEYLQALFAVECPELAVHAAYDGFEAGKAVVLYRPTVVLLDVMMPGLDGSEVCRRLKQAPETAAIRVVAMTGFHSSEVERRMLAAGAETLLRKPFTGSEVIAACGLASVTESSFQQSSQGV
jgi:excisionase family DNA binding protein